MSSSIASSHAKPNTDDIEPSTSSNPSNSVEDDPFGPFRRHDKPWTADPFWIVKSTIMVPIAICRMFGAVFCFWLNNVTQRLILLGTDINDVENTIKRTPWSKKRSKQERVIHDPSSSSSSSYHHLQIVPPHTPFLSKIQKQSYSYPSSHRFILWTHFVRSFL
eukprot:TRINITY_DN1575_c0_g1_i1.p1 TRINITY_DN1575_c0_g1~~TRINITY_DN1575_c0_g1_i1.p1  ORF type:complete len:170 (-),score=45.70 TRINITY_DN1575_c0_g1_i1:123-611(-)